MILPEIPTFPLMPSYSPPPPSTPSADRTTFDNILLSPSRAPSPICQPVLARHLRLQEARTLPPPNPEPETQEVPVEKGATTAHSALRRWPTYHNVRDIHECRTAEGTLPADSGHSKNSIGMTPELFEHKKFHFRYAPYPPGICFVHTPNFNYPGERSVFALQPITIFMREQWDSIWEKEGISLMKFLDRYKPISSEYDVSVRPTYFHPELEFIGIPYRLKVNSYKCCDFPMLNIGNTLDVHDINSPHGRYIIESCPLVRGGSAYLVVHFRYYENQGFTVVNDYRHPSFILEVPACYLWTVPLPSYMMATASTLPRSLSLVQSVSRSLKLNAVERHVDHNATLYQPDKKPSFWSKICISCFN